MEKREEEINGKKIRERRSEKKRKKENRRSRVEEWSEKELDKKHLNFNEGSRKNKTWEKEVKNVKE